MRYKEIIKLAKKALKQPWLYTESEIQYIRKAKKQAKQALKLKHMRKKEDEQES